VIMRKVLFIIFGLMVINSCTSLKLTHPENNPRNIILLIGDGMGPTHVTAGKYSTDVFNLDRFKTIGLVTTHSADKLVTDSGASATALATGVKTYNGAIGYSVERKPLKTVLEFAEDQGMSTGLVSTSSLTHATPASFVAHIDSRQKQPEIAEQIAESDVDVLIGAGWGYFVPKNIPESKREDEKNPLVILKNTGSYVETIQDMRTAPLNKRFTALLTSEHLPPASERDYSLAELTENAIKRLSTNPKGFFLMVEGSQIDWQAHDNNFLGIVSEMLDFDGAIGTALDFAQKDGKTLVVVTADHETGGFAILDGSVMERKISKAEFSTGGHTATMVLVFAAGPGKEQFSGIQDNTDISKKIKNYILK
jgi:alkaline phosphatase